MVIRPDSRFGINLCHQWYHLFLGRLSLGLLIIPQSKLFIFPAFPSTIALLPNSYNIRKSVLHYKPLSGQIFRIISTRGKMHCIDDR